MIIGYSEITLDTLRSGDPLREKIQEIKKAGDRAAALTRQLLAFSRKQVVELKVLDLNSVIMDLNRMLQRTIGEDIKLVTFLGEGLGGVRADPGKIEQVIVNLAVNARDAMPSGGSLTIETANVTLDETYARTHFPGLAPTWGVAPSSARSRAPRDSKTTAESVFPKPWAPPLYLRRREGRNIFNELMTQDTRVLTSSPGMPDSAGPIRLACDRFDEADAKRPPSLCLASRTEPDRRTLQRY